MDLNTFLIGMMVNYIVIFLMALVVHGFYQGFKKLIYANSKTTFSKRIWMTFNMLLMVFMSALFVVMATIDTYHKLNQLLGVTP